MNLSPKSFTLHVKLRGTLIETRDCDSIAEAERHFGQLAGRGRVDCGEIYAAERFDVPSRVLHVR